MSPLTKKRLLRVAIAIGALLTALVVVVAVSAPQPIHPGVVAQCLTGDGLAFVNTSGEPFEADVRGHTYRGTTDNVIDLTIKVIGAWEPHVLDLMTDVLDEIYGGEGVMLDVGANTGALAMVASDHAKSVHAVEPWPPVLDRMRAMVAENELENVVIHPVGYADQPGTLPFFVPEDTNHGAGSFSADSLNQPGETIDLPLVRGDEDLAQAGVKRIDLMKMDIQGYEKPALEGLRQTLTRDRPIVIMELAVLKKEKLGFFSEAELRGAYPDDYTFYRIGKSVRNGFTQKLWSHHTLFCWDTEPQYRLRLFEMKFADDGTHTNLLAVPNERVEELQTKLGEHIEP